MYKSSRHLMKTKSNEKNVPDIDDVCTDRPCMYDRGIIEVMFTRYMFSESNSSL